MKAWGRKQSLRPLPKYFSSKKTKGTLEDFIEVAGSLCQALLSFLPQAIILSPS